MNDQEINEYLRQLPAVDEVMNNEALVSAMQEHSRAIILKMARKVLDQKRRDVLGGKIEFYPGDKNKKKIKKNIIELILLELKKQLIPGLRRVINATGVVIHTNLGRALLSDHAMQAVTMAASGYSNLELDLDTGKRGSRYAPLEGLLTELTGAEAALVVNNNASAVLLALSTLAAGREVIVSRGQLVEIGGSFRIPDVMVQGGARLVEVGTTNKTHPGDYRNAITENTGLLLNVHTSNYLIIGFTRETTIKELAEIGKEMKIPVMSDLGSGSLVDLRPFGLPGEPTVQETVAAGAGVVTFSGDKLLGGPQAGIIVGRKKYIEKMKTNPLTRAIRIDKFTVSALEATLRAYLDPARAVDDIPTLRMLAAAPAQLQPRAEVLFKMLVGRSIPHVKFNIVETVSRVGGGAMPMADLPSVAVEVMPAEIEITTLVSRLRDSAPAVIGRIQNNRLLLDMRTIQDAEFQLLVNTLANCFQ